MKSKIVLFLAAILFAGITYATVGGEPKTEKIKVHGNCGMCEKRIEQAAKSVDGVTSAEWDKKTLMLTVAYDQSKADAPGIHSAVASAGHDTEMLRASDESYEKLHSCCQYERAEKKPAGSSSTQPAGACPYSKTVKSCCS